MSGRIGTDREGDEGRMFESIERLVDVTSDAPGVALGVIRDGRVAFRHCAGLASLEHGVPITPRTRFHIVSATKTFTAAAVVLLAARGRLSLDDPVERHVPELPVAGGRELTIRHLLSMTSGLHDSLEIERLRGVWRPSRERERDLLDILLAQRARSFAPGARYAYCNANFVLLNEIIRRASGLTADEFRWREVAEPLGLRDTGPRAHDGIVLPNLAEGYVPVGDGGFQRGTDLLGISGDVQTSSLDDLLTWVLALAEGSLRGVPITAPMANRAPLDDGTFAYYGLGLAVRQYRGLTVLCHTGTQPGYKAHLCYVPERKLGFVLLANRDDVAPGPVAAAALDRLIDDFPAAHPAQRFPPHAASGRLAGVYVDMRSGEWLALSVRDGVLFGDTLGDTVALYPRGDGSYADADDYRATFPARLRPVPGQPDQLDAELAGMAYRFERCAPPAYTSGELAHFEGVYENTEAAVVHRVQAGEEGLRVTYGGWFDRALTFPLRPLHTDTFLVTPSAPGVSHRHLLRFERDAARHVSAVVLTLERLKGLRLTRRTALRAA